MIRRDQDEGFEQFAEPATARLPAGSPLARAELAYERLQQLYETSTLLTRFESVEHTIPLVIAAVARALPLRSAIFLVESQVPGKPSQIIWQLDGEDALQLHRAKADATRSYTYLVHSGVDLEPGAAETSREAREAWESSISLPLHENYILLPLVAEPHRIFGALHVEGSASFDEVDLVFVNAIVNQVAIAVDRQAVLDARRTAAENARLQAEHDAALADLRREAAARAEADVKLAEAKQRVLADISAMLACSLEYRQTLSDIVRFAVPLLGDLCFIDEQRVDGAVQRLAVAFADQAKQLAFAERVKDLAPRAGSRAPSATVLETGQSILLCEIEDYAALAEADAQAWIMRAIGIQSMMVVALHARGRTLGALTLCVLDSDRRYSADDLALAEQIAQRAAFAIDNARLYEEAQRAKSARDDLLAAVSHDLRNPLTAILACADMMGYYEGDDRRQSRSQLRTIRRAVGRMSRLIQDLQDSASIDAGRLSVHWERLSIESIVRDAIEVLQPLALGQSLQLTADLPSGLPAILADSGRVQQVFANLVGNAIKFTPVGGSITIRAAQVGDFVRFSVSDTGSGIPEHELPRLFERFWQARRTAHLGTGLGLSIAQGIVVAHGGTIEVESQLGSGTTLSFTLPLALSLA